MSLVTLCDFEWEDDNGDFHICVLEEKHVDPDEHVCACGYEEENTHE